MESRRDLLRSQRVCRFCLTKDEPLTSIYERTVKTQNSVPLPLQIMACVAIEAFPSDGMPVTICQICRHFMDQSYRFKQICRQADEALRYFASSGELRGPIEWPLDMLKSLPPGKVKLEDLEYTDEDNDDINEEEEEEEQDEDENSAKVREWRKRKTKPQASSTPHQSKIKVMQRGNEIIIQTEEENTEIAESTKESEKDADTDPTVKKEGETVVPTFSFPCQLCERSFPLKQLLEIHLQKSHRERSFECHICKNKFFTKYDLQKHVLVHTGEKPYECVVCQKKFARHSLLRRHEKIHSEVPLMVCVICDATFFSTEELDAHTAMHQRSRPYKCKTCSKSFTFKQGLLRHESVHLERHPHTCNYCPKTFRTMHMLARHVQAHAGQRPYPCKYCERSFLLPHHYTRHLRVCHNDESWRNKSAVRSKGNTSSFEPQLVYKCEQCSKTFDKQDDLIFHSAIHATQNLTCPLCKDKFENVDDVTEHIKSHAEGSYVCDWCELMFNSEARLDAHVDEVHGETVRETSADADDEEVLCIEGRLVEDEMELQLLRDFREADGDDEEEYDDAREGEEYNEYDIKLTGDDEEGQTLEITPQVKREVDVEFRQKGAKNVSEREKPTPEETEDNMIYTELETVDTFKIAQQRQEQLEAEKNDDQDTGAPLTSNILRKAEEIKKQKKLDVEGVAQKKVPQPLQTKVQQERNHAPVVLKRQPDTIPRQLPTPKKPDFKLVKTAKMHTGMSTTPSMQFPTKVKTSAAQRVMQALKNNEEYKALQDSEETMAEIKPLKGETLKEGDANPDKTSSPSPDKTAQLEQKKREQSKHEKSYTDIENDPSIKASERSLKMLERDLHELKKHGMKSSRPIQRFPSHQRPFKRPHDKEHRFSRDDAESFLKSPERKKTYNSSENRSPVQQKKRLDESAILDDAEREKRREEKRLAKEKERIRLMKILADTDQSDEGSTPEKISQRRNASVDDPNVRRSGRQSKIKDYAKMIRDSTGLSDGSELDDDESDSDNDDGPEYKAPPYVAGAIRRDSFNTNVTPKARRESVNRSKSPTSMPVPSTAPEASTESIPTVKRRPGRPRKNPIIESANPDETPVRSVPVDNSAEKRRPLKRKLKRKYKKRLLGKQSLELLHLMSKKGHPQAEHFQSLLKRGRGRPSKQVMQLRQELESNLSKRVKKPLTTALMTYEELGDVPRKDVPAKRGRKPKLRPVEEQLVKDKISNGENVVTLKSVSSEVQAQKSLLDDAQKTLSEMKKTLADTERITNKDAIKKIESMARTISSSGYPEKIISPSGQTLMKVPASLIKSLPPGVRPLPLPPNIKTTTATLAKEAIKAVNPGQISEMMIGDKVVKVQKIVMTKAEVDAMTKKGLLEMKDGAMLLKQGYKMPQQSEVRPAVPKPAQPHPSPIPSSQPMRVEPIEEPAPAVEEPNPETAKESPVVPQKAEPAKEAPETTEETQKVTTEESPTKEP